MARPSDFITRGSRAPSSLFGEAGRPSASSALRPSPRPAVSHARAPSPAGPRRPRRPYVRACQAAIRLLWPGKGPDPLQPRTVEYFEPDRVRVRSYGKMPSDAAPSKRSTSWFRLLRHQSTAGDRRLTSRRLPSPIRGAAAWVIVDAARRAKHRPGPRRFDHGATRYRGPEDPSHHSAGPSLSRGRTDRRRRWACRCDEPGLMPLRRVPPPAGRAAPRPPGMPPKGISVPLSKAG